MKKDLNYLKNNAEEDYLQVPISGLRYITGLEKSNTELLKQNEALVECLKKGINEINHLKSKYKDIGHCIKYIYEANELLNTLNK